MHRFKASKFKNAAPKPPKRENWITGVSVGSPQCFGKMIAASSKFMAFCQEYGTGGTLGVLPIESNGVRGNIPSLPAHADLITDLDFSPFCNRLLATVSYDGLVKLWTLPDDSSNLQTSLPNNPTCTLSQLSDDGINKIELCGFHPTADDILTTTSFNQVHLWDLNRQQRRTDVSECGEDQIFSYAWSVDGRHISVTNKDKQLRILDPRVTEQIVHCVPGHQNIKDSRVVWLDDNHLLTSGFDRMRQRQLMVWDVRSMSSCVQSIELDTSSGILMPLYDVDTHMLFLCGKAESTLHYWEYHPSKHEVMQVSSHISEGETKGACLVDKKSLDVMSCEVNKVLQLGKTQIIPIPYHVPRKTYRDFHSDLFPPVKWDEPALSSRQWFDGINREVIRSTLDPNKRKSLRVYTPQLDGSSEDVPEPEKIELANGNIMNGEHKVNGDYKDGNHVTKESLPDNKPVISEKPRLNEETSSSEVKRREKPAIEGNSTGGGGGLRNTLAAFEQKGKDSNTTPSANRQKKAVSTFANKYRVSKCRHLKGTPSHRNENIENIRNLGTSVPGESDAFSGNPERVAIPLSGPGGNLTILELSKRGRLPDANLPFLHNGSTVMDFCWDPFDNRRLAVACDDGRVRLWTIPETGLTTAMHEPTQTVDAHLSKVVLVKFNPCAKDVLLTAGQDNTVKVISLSQDNTNEIELEGHEQPILSASWSSNGRYICTVCRDSHIRIYDPRNSTDPIQIGKGPGGNRGARCTWSCDNNIIVVSGFTKSSLRILNIYDVSAIDNPITQFDLDVSPSILMLHYDPGTSTCFLYGRGDSTVYAFEILPESPHFVQLSHHKAVGLHQAWSFLPHNQLDVKKVEFAKALRLTKTHVELVSFTVPRVKMQYFQDDIFPDCDESWSPSMSSSQWFSGENIPLSKLNLQPDDMRPVSGQSSKPVVKFTPQPLPASSNNDVKTPLGMDKDEITLGMDKDEDKIPLGMDKDEDKKRGKELVEAMSDRFDVDAKEGEPKYQTEEGVDPEEWEENEE